MKPSSSSPPSGRMLKKIQDVTKTLQSVQGWRWGVFIFILLLVIGVASLLWEQQVEPKLGMRVTGESTDVSDALPPVVEWSEPDVPFKSIASEKASTSQDIPSAQPASSPSPHLVETLSDQLRSLEDQQSKGLKHLERQHNQWAYFLMLRQDILSGRSFEVTWRRFKAQVSAQLRHAPPFQEAVHILDSIAPRGLLPRAWLLVHVPSFTPDSQQEASHPTSWLERVKLFFQDLFVVRRTKPVETASSQGFMQAERLLKQGHLEAAFRILSQLKVVSTPEVQSWMEAVHLHCQAQQALEKVLAALTQPSGQEDVSK